MDDALRKAMGALRIRDVYLRTSQAQLAADFDPKYDPESDALEVQFQHLVTHFSVLALEQEGESPIQLFRVFVQLGARWLASGPESGSNEQDLVRAAITGTMVAEYEMDSDPGSDALKAFALRNASYHIWPYWREFLATLGLRMNLPKIMLPAVQFPMMPSETGAKSEASAD